MSYREGPETIQEYIRELEDRLRSLEHSNRISARSWVIGENTDGNLIFTSQGGRVITLANDGLDYTLAGEGTDGPLVLGESSATAYRGDRGAEAYAHRLLTSSNPHNVTKADVGLSDVPNLDFTLSIAANTAKVTNATHTGDVTGDQALTITPNAVTNSKLAEMPTKTYKGNTTGVAADPTDVPVATLKADLALTKADVGLSDVPNTDFTSAVALNTAKVSYPPADQAKLAGIEAGATANISDDDLKNRANHTGTQAISTVVSLQSSLDAKQATLVSGTNIKTVNGNSLLGSGNIVIAGGGGTVDTSGTPVANDFARFTDADTIEGRSYSEVRADLGLEIGTDVMAYAANNATSSSTNTFTNKTIDANGTGNSISNLEVADFAGSAIVTEGEGLASSDNDTSLPTTASVIDYVDSAVASGISDGDKGDITISGGGTTYTVDNDAITYAKIQNVSATNRILGRITSGAGDAEELTAANVRTIINVEDGADVTDATNVASAGAFMTATDDTDDITIGATNKFATAAEKTKLGHISVTQAVDLDTMESNIATNNAKVTNATHTGDVAGSTALTIADDAVTYAKIQDVTATDRILGRVTAGSGIIEEITFTDQAQQLADDTSFTAMRTTLGVGTSDSPEFTAINVGHATDTTIARSTAGNITVEGNLIYRAGGTDVPVTDGGTGSSTAAGAATNLGLGTGSSPQFTAVNVGHATDTTITRTAAGTIAVEGNVIYRAGGTDVPVTDGGTGASDASTARTNLGLAIGSNVQAYDANNATSSSTNTFTNKTIDANGTGNSISNLEVADFTAASIVTAAEGLASSDNDTSIPTTAAVIDAIDVVASAGVSDGDKGDITVSGSGATWTVDNDVVTNAKAANMAQSTIKGRAAAAGTGDPTDLTATQVRTIINVEDGADVTDATNVNSAGAVMESDTTTASMSFVVDEDTMSSNSAIKLATQQSIKAYVDTNISGWTELDRTTLGSAGDTISLSFAGKKYLRFVGGLIGAGGVGLTINTIMQFNSDTATKYSYNYYAMGASGTMSSVAVASQAAIPLDSSQPYNTNSLLVTGDIMNFETSYKQLHFQGTWCLNAATNVPTPIVGWGFWENNVDQITSIQITNSVGTGDFAAGSEFIVYGHD